MSIMLRCRVRTRIFHQSSETIILALAIWAERWFEDARRTYLLPWNRTEASIVGISAPDQLLICGIINVHQQCHHGNGRSLALDRTGAPRTRATHAREFYARLLTDYHYVSLCVKFD